MRFLFNTVLLGAAAALTCSTFGFFLALVQVRTQFRAKRLLHGLLVMPILFPQFVVSMSIIMLLGRSGLVTNSLFGLHYDITGFDGLLLATSLSFLPIAYLNFLTLFRSFDASLEEAAANLGAGLWFRLRTLVLPLLAPGIAHSLILAFSFAISDLGNAMIIGGAYDVLPEQIYLAVVGEYDLDRASVLSVMLFGPSLLAFGTHHFWLHKRHQVGPAGRTRTPVKKFSRRSATWPLYALAMMAMVINAVLYGYILIGAFTKVWNIDFEPTLDNIRFVAEGAGREALVDTMTLALLSAPFSGLVGLSIAAAISKKRYRVKGVVDFLTLLGVAVPGTMISLGLVLAYNSDLLGGALPRLNGTAGLIVIALTVRSLPGVVRVAVVVIDQLSENLYEASRVLGATSRQTLFRIVLPLVRPAVMTSLVWTFVRSITTLSPVVFLATPQWRVMTEQMLREADQGRFGESAAYGVVLVAVVLSAISILRATNSLRLYLLDGVLGQSRVNRPQQLS